MRKIAAFVALGLGLALAITGAPSAQSQRAPAVYTAEIDGIIHPVVAEYVSETIRRADAAGAALIVFTLRTPGGLVDSTRDINNAIIRARTPVAVFVARQAIAPPPLDF